MKKLLLGLVAIFATSAFSADMYFDADLGYAYGEGGSHSVNVEPGFYFTVAKMDSFVKGISVGGTVDYNLTFSPATAHAFAVYAMGRLEMDYNLVYELGLGYNFGDFSNLDGNIAVKTGLAYYYPLNNNMKLGLVADFNYAYSFSASTGAWGVNVGPSFAMDL